MEEVQSTKEASPPEPDSLTLSLETPEMKEKITLPLTRGELTVINAFMKSHLQTKGYEMIQFAHGLFVNLDAALETQESTKVFE